MPFDPTLPANNSPVVSAELRNQFNALKAMYDAQAAQIAALQATVAAQAAQIAALQTDLATRVTSDDLNDAINGTAQNPTGVSPLSVGWDNPISSDNTQAIVDRVNELISALGR